MLTTTQSKAVVAISELLVELSKSVKTEEELFRVNAAHFLLCKLAQTLREDRRISVEA
jgi:hypothetical protein